MKSARGFTLIELLVAIAIIGVLSAIALSALNVARAKGNDATIKTEMNVVRQQAEVYYSNIATALGSGIGSYNTTNSTINPVGNICVSSPAANTMFNDTTINNALAKITSLNSGSIDCYINSAGTAYSVAVGLTALPNSYWCMDNLGYSSNLSKTYHQPYTALTGTCTAANSCAAHPANPANASICQ